MPSRKIRLVWRLQDNTGKNFGSQKIVYRGRILADGVPSRDVLPPGELDILVGGTISVNIDEETDDWLKRHEALALGRMAVAVMRPSSQKPEALSSMQLESEVMQQMTSDNFIKLIMGPELCDVTYEDDSSCRFRFMVQEEVKPIGYDLYTLYRNYKHSGRRVPDDTLRTLVMQMTDALEHLHDKGYVHRDMKPDNVLLDRNNVLKLIDFGFAATPGGPAPPRNTSVYMAPETNTLPRNPSIDLWGVGVIIQFLSTGIYDHPLPIHRDVATHEGECIIQGHRFSPKTLEAMRGLLKREIYGEDARWNLARLRQWATPTPRRSLSGGTWTASLTSGTSTTAITIVPWTRLVHEVFIATLPREFPPTLLRDLRLKSMVLMIDDRITRSSVTRSSASTSWCPACVNLLSGGARGNIRDRPDATIPSVNILPDATTTVRGNQKVYFAVKRTADDATLFDGTLDKLGLDDIITAARLQSDSTNYDKLVSTARDIKENLVTTLPKFDVFYFPDHCAGAALGFDQTGTKNVLQLREKFRIPLAGIVRADDSIEWWPGAEDTIQKGDQGLVMRVPEFSSALRETVAVDLKKLGNLNDENDFKRVLGLDARGWLEWQTKIERTQDPTDETPAAPGGAPGPAPSDGFLEARFQALTFDIRSSVDSSKLIIIGYHGGCPDGCGAAYMLKTALESCHPGIRVKSFPIGHGVQHFASVVEPGSVVISLDLAPTLGDIDALKTASSIMIMDHHVSEKDTLEKLQEAIPTIVNLSELGGNECGSSLVVKLVEDIMPFDPKVVTMLHKMDVFTHTLPDELKADYNLFRSFLIQNGERCVTIDLVEKMFTEYEASMEVGRGLFDVILARTDAQAVSAECVIDEPGFRMFIVEQSADCGPIDFPRYQEKIDELKSDTPTLFLTRTHAPLPSGVFNLGLRRAGAGVDITKITAILRETPPFVSGGGHPFAGGAQSKTLAAREEIIELVGAAARQAL